MNPATVAEKVRAAGVDHHTAARAMVNALATNRGLAPPWDAPVLDLPTLADVNEVGEVHQLLLGRQDGQRGEQGSYYTPDPLAGFLARFVMDIQMSKLGDRHPMDVLLMDPACGAGVLLVRAARALTARLVEVELGCRPTDALVRGLLPHLAADCVFGVDVDPVAVDLTKSALWLESDGVPPITWMDRNVIVGNVLEGDEPPKLAERQQSFAGQPQTEGALFDLEPQEAT